MGTDLYATWDVLILNYSGSTVQVGQLTYLPLWTHATKDRFTLWTMKEGLFQWYEFVVQLPWSDFLKN